MINKTFLRAVKTIIFLSCIFNVATANAVPVLASQIVTPTGTLASGLNGSFADVAPYAGPADIEAAVLQAENSPTATFISTALDYPNGMLDTVVDSTTLDALLGSDAASISGNGSATLGGSMFVFEGLIDISAAFDAVPENSSAIHTSFTVSSDDGFRLWIGNTMVSSFFGIRSFGSTQEYVEFEAAGLYDFRLEWWENTGGTGLEVTTDFLGGYLDDSVLYHQVSSVPEPGMLLLLSLAILGLVALQPLQRYQRQRVTA